MDDFKRALTDRVEFNCDVSDARYWGYYSICGLLMSLRMLYMARHGIEPWEQVDRVDIQKWISQKESRWEELEDEDFRELTINGKSYDPFDVNTINLVLKGEGLIYGAGYGLFKKPSFFLADLHANRRVHEQTIYSAKREYARDLFWSPGMSQGSQIFLRLEPLKALLWDKYLESKARDNPSLEYAFSHYGFHADTCINEDFARKLEELVQKYSEVILYHELGEAMEEFPYWPEMLFAANDKNSEFFLRAIKDLLADTSENGPVKWCIDSREKGNIGLCIALMDRYRLKMYPELKQAFEKFMTNEDWDLLDKGREAVYERIALLRDELVQAYMARKDKGDLLAKIAELQSRMQ